MQNISVRILFGGAIFRVVFGGANFCGTRLRGGGCVWEGEGVWGGVLGEVLCYFGDANVILWGGVVCDL